MRKSSQMLAVILLSFIISGFALAAYSYQRSFPLLWAFGIAIGFVFYRSGICFSTAFSDIVIFRNFRMFRTSLILLLVSFLGFNIVQVYSNISNGIIPGYIFPVGLHTAIGGILFGMGMVLTGACVCGTLQKLSEGFLLFWFVLGGVVIGSLLGAYHYPWWEVSYLSWEPVFLPNIFGWRVSWLLTVIILVGVFGGTFLLERRK